MITFNNRLEDIEEVNQDFKALTPGGHVVVIKTAKDHTGDNGTSTKVTVDIAEGDLKGYFQEGYDKNTKVDKKWNNNATKYFSHKQENEKYSKAFGTAINNSNANTNVFVKVDGKDAFDETRTIGKKVGAMFGLKEYRNQEGELKTTVEVRNFRSIEGLDKAKMPKVAVINGKNSAGYDTYDYVDYDKYMAKGNNTSNESVINDPFEGMDLNDVEIEL